MIKILFVFLAFCILAGCANTLPAPTGKHVWTNAPMVSELQEGLITYKQWSHKFVIAKSLCTIESLKIPIPSPSCSTIASANCSSMTGVSLGVCQSQPQGQQCNYSSVNSAKSAQEDVFNSCMFISDWELVWQPFESECVKSALNSKSKDASNCK